MGPLSALLGLLPANPAAQASLPLGMGASHVLSATPVAHRVMNPTVHDTAGARPIPDRAASANMPPAAPAYPAPVARFLRSRPVAMTRAGHAMPAPLRGFLDRRA